VNGPLDPTERAVIERMRAALDEVAADADVPHVLRVVHPQPPARRWLGVAAVTVLLAGGATYALIQRSDDDPAAAPADTAAAEQPTSTAATAPPPSSTSTTSTTSTTVADVAVTPWYAIDAPPFDGDAIVSSEAAVDEHFLFQAAYTVTSGDVHGFLTVVVAQGLTAGVEGDYATEQLDVPEGTAYFLRPHANDVTGTTPMDHGYELRWFHADGTAWLFRSQGLDRDLLVSIALGAQQGSGLPIVFTDPAVEGLSMGSPAEQIEQDYTIDGGRVRLWVERSGVAMQDLISAANIVDVTVAGVAGYAAQMDDNRIEVTWDAGDGWWGHLSIAPEIARGADGIIASVTKTTMPA
jgi:hypothetical protein